MSYDILFEIKVDGVDDVYVDTGYCNANTTWNLRRMIVESTGLEWKNDANNGLCKDIIPYIEKGLAELLEHPNKYKQYEAENGWGTVNGCIRFFTEIIQSWCNLCNDEQARQFANVTYFFIA